MRFLKAISCYRKIELSEEIAVKTVRIVSVNEVAFVGSRSVVLNWGNLAMSGHICGGRTGRGCCWYLAGGEAGDAVTPLRCTGQAPVVGGKSVAPGPNHWNEPS